MLGEHGSFASDPVWGHGNHGGGAESGSHGGFGGRPMTRWLRFFPLFSLIRIQGRC